MKEQWYPWGQENTTSGKSGWREGAGPGAGRGVKAEVEVEEQVHEVFLKEDEQQQQQQQQVVWRLTPEGSWEPVGPGDVLQEVREEQRWLREQWELEKKSQKPRNWDEFYEKMQKLPQWKGHAQCLGEAVLGAGATSSRCCSA